MLSFRSYLLLCAVAIFSALLLKGEARTVLRDDTMYRLMAEMLEMKVSAITLKGNTTAEELKNMTKPHPMEADATLNVTLVKCFLNATGDGSGLDPTCEDNIHEQVYQTIEDVVGSLHSCSNQSYGNSLVGGVTATYHEELVNTTVLVENIKSQLMPCVRFNKTYTKELNCMNNVLKKNNDVFLEALAEIGSTVERFGGLSLLVRGEEHQCVGEAVASLARKCQYITADVESCRVNATRTDIV